MPSDDEIYSDQKIKYNLSNRPPVSSVVERRADVREVGVQFNTQGLHYTNLNQRDVKEPLGRGNHHPQ